MAPWAAETQPKAWQIYIVLKGWCRRPGEDLDFVSPSLLSSIFFLPPCPLWICLFPPYPLAVPRTHYNPCNTWFVAFAPQLLWQSCLLFNKAALEHTGKGQGSTWEESIWLKVEPFPSPHLSHQAKLPAETHLMIHFSKSIGTDRTNQDEAKWCPKKLDRKTLRWEQAGRWKSSKHGSWFCREFFSGFGICR